MQRELLRAEEEQRHNYKPGQEGGSKEFSWSGCAGVSFEIGHFISRARFLFCFVFSLLVNWYAQPEQSHMQMCHPKEVLQMAPSPANVGPKSPPNFSGLKSGKVINSRKASARLCTWGMLEQSKGSQALIKKLPFHSLESRSAVKQRKLVLFQLRS